MKVCDKTCIFCFFPIINKYLCMARRSLLSRCPSYLLKDCFFIVFDSSAKFPVGLLAGNQYQMGHYDECIEILVNAGESSGGQLKGQYCLAEIWFDSSYSPRTDPYTLNYDPQASAWEKIKVRNNK